MPVRGQPVSRFDGPVGWGPLVGLLGLLPVQGALMSKTQHTSGPWEMKFNPASNGCPAYFYGVVGPDGEKIGVEGFRLASGDEARANARLIAAAPDMKAALIGIIDMAEHAGFGPDSPIILTARAAIAKATGDA